LQGSKLISNLETLSANAAQTSANLRDVSVTLNNPTTITMLQQTLDSARATFENTQKITSDLDELTGDPKLRENLKRLINGLSGLVSSTQQLQQQAEISQILTAPVVQSPLTQPAATPQSIEPVPTQP
jgi:phospholipid/cholesterol/gamma-HCH transport system substrate-binding protein